MRYSISNTAEYGDMKVGPTIVDEHVKENMKAALKRIQSGEFAKAWVKENEEGCPNFNRMRKEHARHQIEEIGKEIRSKIKFSAAQKLVSEIKDS